MRTFLVSVIATFFILASAANAQECVTTQSDLVEMLERYSAAHGTPFVIDPRVNGRVTLIGIDELQIDRPTLVGDLNIHGYAALSPGDVVYVMPIQIGESAGDTFGGRW